MHAYSHEHRHEKVLCNKLFFGEGRIAMAPWEHIDANRFQFALTLRAKANSCVSDFKKLCIL